VGSALVVQGDTGDPVAECEQPMTWIDSADLLAGSGVSRILGRTSHQDWVYSLTRSEIQFLKNVRIVAVSAVGAGMSESLYRSSVRSMSAKMCGSNPGSISAARVSSRGSPNRAASV
jgi:hypothetical protein